LALPSFASWKTHCDGRAFFIARSVLKRKRRTVICQKVQNLFKHINIAPHNIHIPSSTTDNYQAFCESYEQRIAECGGIDLQVLGIGSDGHIGFNEPSSSLGSRTRIKTLTKQTIDDNARFFKEGEKVPIYAITMGVGTILEAKRIESVASLPGISQGSSGEPPGFVGQERCWSQVPLDVAQVRLREPATIPNSHSLLNSNSERHPVMMLQTQRIMLLANGEAKAEAVAGAIEGPVTSMNTASALQLHKRVTFYLDQAAASKLEMREYFEWIQAKMPGGSS
jgi:6-phosphogluconolactonase/glucosamine-6-phosphate isomerase/deaminase